MTTSIEASIGTEAEKVDGFIVTYTGDTIYPLNPDPAHIHIEDIAHALANSCRFTGHVREFYSVGQHSVLASLVVSPELAMTALLHDASEAYLSDIARPVKQQPGFGAVYREAEEKLMHAIAERFEIEWPMPDEIRVADSLLLVTEARDLMAGGTSQWSKAYQEIEPLPMPITSWLPREAETRFLTRYYELRG